VLTLRDFLEKINISAELAFDEPMAAHTSFGIGGPADAFAKPSDAESAVRLLEAAREEGIPLFVLGAGANILVGDRGIRGIVVDSSRLSKIDVSRGRSEGLLVAEAGATVDRICEAARDAALAGLEAFYGMPGSAGGAAFMNARCYEVEMSERIAWIDVLGPGKAEARRKALVPSEWGYKRSPFQSGGSAEGAAILAVANRVAEGDSAAIGEVMAAKRADREAKGHYRLPSAGSMFKNDRAFGAPTGKLLEDLGFRGRRIGDAMVSSWHANIFVNAGRASASDMVKLIELARAEARDRLGFELEPEVLMIGKF
jgi:UDP-N-acetylmuramate dehydrogenase